MRWIAATFASVYVVAMTVLIVIAAAVMLVAAYGTIRLVI